MNASPYLRRLLGAMLFLVVLTATLIFAAQHRLRAAAGPGGSSAAASIAALLIPLGVCGLVAYALSLHHARALRELAASAQRLAGSPPDARSDELAQVSSAIQSMERAGRENIEVLARDRNQLIAVLGGMVEGVIAVDGGERIVHMNRAAGAALDLDPETLGGRKVWEAVRVPAINQAISAAMQSAQAQHSEMRLPGIGQDQVIELYASPLADSQNRSAGAVLVMHDVTGLRRLETMRRDFVANVSHELKTPVTAIHAMAETMLDDAEMDAAVRARFLARIGEQSERLSALVGDLLSLSRIESSAGGMERERLDLRVVAREALALFTAQAEAKDLELSADLPQDALFVLGDREALRQAAGNLLDNALKYTVGGGSVTLSLRAADGKARLTVRDSGPGIEAAHQPRLFERFYRVDKARSRELGGTGLGLAIVKHVALAHGGSVGVESAPGKGSLFWVELPSAN